MFLLVERLKELVKSYTILATVATATGTQEDRDKSALLLKQINDLRLALAIEAEMKEVFYHQMNVPASANVNATINRYFSKNDIAFIIKRGIAKLVNTTLLSLMNQGIKRKTITRDPVAWQQLFATVQNVALGQQTLFDLPETLRFGENQALNFGITGQNAVGFIFLHGATLKDNMEETAILDIRREFLTDEGETLYLPETQLVPFEFLFPTPIAPAVDFDTFATDPNGSTEIFTVKNSRSVLLLEVSTTATNARINSLTDEGRNQSICERIEMAGVASNFTNQFCTFYELPFPHLLRRGDRLKCTIQNGSPMLANATEPANVKQNLCFKGITL